MASNFAFQPMGLSQQVTVISTLATTITFNLVAQGGVTAAISGGNLRPSGLRIANLGPVEAFLAFGASAPTVAVGNGLALLAQSVETFSIRGEPAMAVICGGTTTLNITPGEGL